jgi:hypothetical protein
MMTEAWERLPGETNKAFNAFCIYRDLRQNRSFTKAQIQLGKKSKSYIAHWSKKYNWIERVKAFDDDEDRKNRIKQQESIQKMNDRQAQQAETFQRILFLPVTAISARLKKNRDNKTPAIEDLNQLDTIQLIEMIGQMSRNYGNLVNIERIARGAPTEIGKNENTIIVPNNIAKYGEIVANDEKATEKLTEYLFCLGDSENGKPGNDGDAPVGREVSDSSSHKHTEQETS